MSTTKRLLALLLCVAIVMGLCTTAFAAVSDEEYASASAKIQWLIDNGYVEGDEGGLRAEDTITRAEFATILARALVSKDEYAVYANLANGFTDVAATDWFAGAVNYCFSVDAVAGFGDGTFKPNANVTGIQAAKMILCGVLGYAEDAYVNTAKWALNVYADASAAGLFEDVEGDSGEDATRADCFTMLYNALYVKGVTIGHNDCAGTGLAYIKDYDVAADLYLIKGDGSNDAPYEYSVAKGLYTADSFGAFCDEAEITLYQYVADTTTGKGDLKEAYSVNLDADNGEKYFFVKVACPAGETWYKFVPAGAYAYADFEGIVIANEYADLYADSPLKAGKTTIRTEKGDITVLTTTTLDDLGMTVKFSTLDEGKGGYTVKALAQVGTDKVTIVTTEKEWNALFEQGPTELKYAKDAEYFIDFDNKAAGQVEAAKVILAADGTVYAIKGAVLSAKAVEDDFKAGVIGAAAQMTWAYFEAEYLTEAKDAVGVTAADFAADKFVNGYIYKFINNVDSKAKKDEEVDFAFVLTSKGVAAVETMGPEAPETIGAATSFAGVDFGGGDGKEVSLIVEIDGVTYITEAASEIVTPAKVSETKLPSEIDRAAMVSKHYTIDVLDQDETYYVYADLLGNRFAGIQVGVGDYVLVTDISKANGNLRGYTYNTYLVFGAADEDTYVATFPTLDDLSSFGFDADKFNGVRNTLRYKGWATFGEVGVQETDDYWTALASFYNKDEEAKTVSLLDAQADNGNAWVVAIDPSNNTNGYNANIAAKTEKLSNVALRGIKNDTIGNANAADLYIDKDTEIYIVTGVDKKGYTGMLLDCEYSVGYESIPNILYSNIHGIYGIVTSEEVKAEGPGGAGAPNGEPPMGGNEEPAYKYTAEVLVIEVTSNTAGVGAFVVFDEGMDAAQNKLDVADAVLNDSTTNVPTYQGKANYVGFAVVDNETVIQAIPATTINSSYIGFSDMLFLTDKDASASYFFSNMQRKSAGLSLLYIEEAVCTVSKSVPVYKVDANGDFKAVSEKDLKENDQLVLVFTDPGYSIGSSRNTTFSVKDVAWMLDVTQSSDAVKEYFGLGKYYKCDAAKPTDNFTVANPGVKFVANGDNYIKVFGIEAKDGYTFSTTEEVKEPAKGDNPFVDITVVTVHPSEKPITAKTAEAYTELAFAVNGVVISDEAKYIADGNIPTLNLTLSAKAVGYAYTYQYGELIIWDAAQKAYRINGITVTVDGKAYNLTAGQIEAIGTTGEVTGLFASVPVKAGSEIVVSVDKTALADLDRALVEVMNGAGVKEISTAITNFNGHFFLVKEAEGTVNVTVVDNDPAFEDVYYRVGTSDPVQADVEDGVFTIPAKQVAAYILVTAKSDDEVVLYAEDASTDKYAEVLNVYYVNEATDILNGVEVVALNDTCGKILVEAEADKGYKVSAVTVSLNGATAVDATEENGYYVVTPTGNFTKEENVISVVVTSEPITTIVASAEAGNPFAVIDTFSVDAVNVGTAKEFEQKTEGTYELKFRCRTAAKASNGTTDNGFSIGTVTVKVNGEETTAKPTKDVATDYYTVLIPASEIKAGENEIVISASNIDYTLKSTAIKVSYEGTEPFTTTSVNYLVPFTYYNRNLVLTDGSPVGASRSVGIWGGYVYNTRSYTFKDVEAGATIINEINVYNSTKPHVLWSACVNGVWKNGDGLTPGTSINFQGLNITLDPVKGIDLSIVVSDTKH